MAKTNDELKAYHALYCKVAGLDLPWDMARRFAWEVWALSFTLDDTRMLIEYHQRNARQGKPARSLLFRNLIGGPGSVAYAQEDLAQAKAEKRTPRYAPAKEQVLRATGRSDAVPHGEARTAAQVLQAKELAYLNFKRSMQEEGLA